MFDMEVVEKSPTKLFIERLVFKWHIHRHVLPGSISLSKLLGPQVYALFRVALKAI